MAVRRLDFQTIKGGDRMTTRSEARVDRGGQGVMSLADRPVVYFIQEGDDGAVKIGLASRYVKNRMSTLQCGNPRPLRLIGVVLDGTVQLERAWQRRFAHVALVGEWFEPTAELLAAIAEASPNMDRVVLK